MNDTAETLLAAIQALDADRKARVLDLLDDLTEEVPASTAEFDYAGWFARLEARRAHLKQQNPEFTIDVNALLREERDAL